MHTLYKISLLSFAIASAIGRAQASDYSNVPKNCFSGVRTVPGFVVALSGGISGYYKDAMEIRKRDVYCVGENITIDTPIYTNGGDVFLYAKHLRIKARIDTRVYLSGNFDAHFMDPNVVEGYHPGEGAPYDHNSLYLMTVAALREQAFLSWFRQYYAPIDKHKSELAVGDNLPWPHLPDGLSPPQQASREPGTVIRNGKAPPDVNVDSFTSGSVTIVVHHIISSKTDLTPGALIITDGAHGGLGGAGQPPRCIGPLQYSGGSGCAADGYNIAGENVAGGPPGKAGRISIYSSDAGGADWLAARASSDPGITMMQRIGTPTATEINGTVAHGRDLGLFDNPKYPPLPKERVKVVATPGGELLRAFYYLTLDPLGIRTYDLLEMGSRAQTDSSNRWLTSRDYLASQLWAILSVRLMSISIGAAENRTVDRKPDLSVCEAKPFGFGELKDVVTRIKSTCANYVGDVTPWQVYLDRKGGLANVSNPNLDATVLQARNERAQSVPNEDMAQILAAIVKANTTLEKMYVSIQRSFLTTNLQQIQARLSALKGAMAATSAKNSEISNGIFGSLVQIGDLGAKATALATAINNFSSRPESNDPNGKSGFSNVGALGRSAEDFSSAFGPAFLTSTTSGLGEEYRVTQEQKRRILDAILQLDHEAQEFYRQNNILQSMSLVNIIDKRRIYDELARSRADLFDDLLRAMILHFATAPNPDPAEAARNAMTVATFIDSKDTSRSNFTFNKIFQDCKPAKRRIKPGKFTQAESDCVVVGRMTDQAQVLEKAITIGEQSGNITLYRINKGKDPITLSLRGLAPKDLKLRLANAPAQLGGWFKPVPWGAALFLILLTAIGGRVLFERRQRGRHHSM